MSKCIIIGAGSLYTHKPVPDSSDYVIAADGGYEYLRKMNLKADVVIGDFDSLLYKPLCSNMIELPKEKDDTDMLAAIKHGLKEGFLTFHIYGGTGGRFDHTIANIQCLAYLARLGARGFLYGENFIATCIHNGSMDFESGHKGIISVFTHSDTAEGVFIKGLKYELHNAILNNTYPLGVSNEFTGTAGCISVRNGTLIIIMPYGEN